MDFLIATHNMKKRAELERILKPIGVRVLLAEEAGGELTDVEETGVTFEENAFLKADSGCGESGTKTREKKLSSPRRTRSGPPP